MDFSSMSGWDFERYCADCLLKKGFAKAEVTSGSGDHGVDIIAEQNGIRFGIQCKLYQGQIPNKAVQEAYTGASYYDCDVAVIMSNSELTKQAQTEAKKLRVKFWNVADYTPEGTDRDYNSMNTSTESYENYKRQQKSNESRIENEMNSRLQLFDNADENCLLLPQLRNSTNRYQYEKASQWLVLSKLNEDTWYPIIRSMQTFCDEVNESPKNEPAVSSLPGKLLYLKHLSSTFSITGESLRLSLRKKCELIDSKLRTSQSISSTDSKSLNLTYWEVLYLINQSNQSFECIQKVMDAIFDDEYAIIEDRDALIALLDSNRFMVDFQGDLTAQVSEYQSAYRRMLHHQNIISANLHFCKNSFPFLQDNSDVKDMIEKQTAILEQPNAKTRYEKKKQEAANRIYEQKRNEERQKQENERILREKQEIEKREKERQLKEQQEKRLLKSIISEYNDECKKINLGILNQRKELESKTRIAISQAQQQISDLLKKKQPFTFFRKERDAKIDATIATVEQHIEQLKKQLEHDIAECDAEAQEKLKDLQEQILDKAEKGGVKEELLKNLNLL